MLDVVEDEEELAVAHCCRQRVQRRLAGHLRDRDRARDRRQEQPWIAERRELDDHSAVGEARCSLPGGGEREARLAAPSCSGEDEQPHVARREEGIQRTQIALASDKRVRRHGEHAHGIHRRDARFELGILLEDAELQRAKLDTRLEPELLIQAVSQPAVVVERLGLTAGPVERQHCDALHALAEGVLSCHRERLTKHLVVAAELRQGFEPRLERREPKLFEPPGLGSGEVLVHHIGIRRPSPERERAIELRERERGIPLRHCRDRVVEKTFEPVGIEGHLLAAERVPARPRHERFSTRQRLAKLGDIHLQQLSGRCGRTHAPDRVDECVRRARLTTGERQRREQPPVLRGTQFDRSVLAGDLERPKNA